MKLIAVVAVYVAAVILIGCQALTLSARAAGTAAMKLGYYGVASSAFKVAAGRNPRDLRTRVALAQAEMLNGDDVDAFGAYTRLIVRTGA